MIHLAPGTDFVVTRSGGWRILDLAFGPLHSGSADLTSMFIASGNRITEMVQSWKIPTYRLHHSDGVSPAGIFNLKSL